MRPPTSRTRALLAAGAGALLLGAPPASAQDPADPYSGISQYVEELPTAGGSDELEQPPAAPRPPAPQAKRVIEAAGPDAPALTRLVASQPPPPPPPPPSVPPAPPPPVEREQQELVHRPDAAPVSARSVSAALSTAAGGTETHVLALLVGLPLLAALAVAGAIRSRR